MESSRPVERQRDILSLRFSSETVLDKSHKVCRAVQRRILRRGHAQSRANDCISTINRLGGFPLLEGDSAVPIGKGTSDAMNLISSAFHSFDGPPSDVTSEGALRELLAKCGHYSNVRPIARSWSRGLLLALAHRPCWRVWLRPTEICFPTGNQQCF